MPFSRKRIYRYAIERDTEMMQRAGGVGCEFQRARVNAVIRAAVGNVDVRDRRPAARSRIADGLVDRRSVLRVRDDLDTRRAGPASRREWDIEIVVHIVDRLLFGSGA